MPDPIELKLSLSALQCVSITLAGLLGVLGVIHDYKDKQTRELTRWGASLVRAYRLPPQNSESKRFQAHNRAPMDDTNP